MSITRMTGGRAKLDSLPHHGLASIFGLPGAQAYGLSDLLARQFNAIPASIMLRYRNK
jgi:thiamine pyrophosphate-dependent acetolactate synthase large subunit-like protein